MCAWVSNIPIHQSHKWATLCLGRQTCPAHHRFLWCHPGGVRVARHHTRTPLHVRRILPKSQPPRPGKAWNSSGIGSDKLWIQRRSPKTPARRSRAPGVGPARRGRATLLSPGCCRKSVRDDARALACWYRGETSHHIVKG